MEVRPIACLCLGHQEIASSLPLLGKKRLRGGAGSSSEIHWEREGLMLECVLSLLHSLVFVQVDNMGKMD